jgi:hypothetical protein
MENHPYPPTTPAQFWMMPMIRPIQGASIVGSFGAKVLGCKKRFINGLPMVYLWFTYDLPMVSTLNPYRDNHR